MRPFIDKLIFLPSTLTRILSILRSYFNKNEHILYRLIYFILLYNWWTVNSKTLIYITSSQNNLLNLCPIIDLENPPQCLFKRFHSLLVPNIFWSIWLYSTSLCWREISYYPFASQRRVFSTFDQNFILK